MLKLLTKNGYQPLSERTNFNIVYDYDGNQVLSFDISTSHTLFKDVHEEGTIKYRDNLHLIKKINRRKHIATIECILDLNEWKEGMHQNFHTEYKLFSEVMLLVSPDGWIIEEAGTVTGRRAMTLEGVNNYDILMHCKKLYNITYEFHIDKKTIKVIKPDTIQSRGLFMSDELNLRDVEFKGDSSTFATRLFAYGKKIEEKDEEGKVISTSYVNFASINDGKEYVDNLEYSKNVISAYWQDDRYIDPQSLLDDAIDKLKQLAMPNRSYSCKLLDYSRTNEKYKMLDFKLYDKATLIDSINKVCIQHQIVQYKEYPDNENLNEVVLSSTFKSIIGTIDGIKQSVSTIDTEIKRTETQINEIIRDVQSNTMRINNTYSKGETEVRIENVVQQTANELNVSIGKVEQQGDKLESNFNELSITVDGLTNRISSTGGNNLIKDSMGVYRDGWNGNYLVDKSVEVKKRNDYGFAIMMKNASIKQNIQVPDGDYTLSFLYKKHINLSNVKMIVNGEEFMLGNNEYTNFVHVVKTDSGSINIEFISDTEQSCTIVNLMLNKGKQSMVWSLNSNETWTDTMKMSSSGLTIESSGADVLFNAKADIIGFKNKNTNEYVAVFTDVGADMKELNVRNKANIVNILVQNINGHTSFNFVKGGGS